MNGDFPIQFSVYTKLSHTPRILCLGSLFRIQNGGLTTQHDTEKRRESFLIWPIFERNFTFKWVKVSIFHIILYFFMIRDDPSRSELIRPGLAVRVDPVRLLYLPVQISRLSNSALTTTARVVKAKHDLAHIALQVNRSKP